MRPTQPLVQRVSERFPGSKVAMTWPLPASSTSAKINHDYSYTSTPTVLQGKSPYTFKGNNVH